MEVLSRGMRPIVALIVSSGVSLYTVDVRFETSDGMLPSACPLLFSMQAECRLCVATCFDGVGSGCVELRKGHRAIRDVRSVGPDNMHQF